MSSVQYQDQLQNLEQWPQTQTRAENPANAIVETDISEAGILRATSAAIRASQPKSSRPCSRTPTSGVGEVRREVSGDDDDDLGEDECSGDEAIAVGADLQPKESRGLSNLLHRKRVLRARRQKREKVRMVGQQLHEQLQHAFRSWFRDTESDGTPILPAPLSKKYQVLPTVLGQGSFAVVKEVVVKSSGERRALKIIAKKPLKENSEKMLKEEIKILEKVEHPNVIKMWNLYESKEGVFIVTDLCRGGELFDRLVEKVHYNELDARHIMKQIFDGVEYLHTQDIIHRDLKPENILLRDKSDPSDIAISDFGLSRFIPEEGLLMTACGSPQYVSPEVLLGKGYGPAVDVWSSGVIAYCLLAGYTPFYGEDQPTLFQEIVKMNVEFEPQYWYDISDTAKDFILHCLCPAEKRMTAKEALQHPWLRDLPPVHAEKDRGACLKNKAIKHLSARQRVARAVTAVEAVNYLQRLHALRQQHSAEDMEPNELSKLLRAATHLHLSSTEQKLSADEIRQENASDSQQTITTSSSVSDTENRQAAKDSSAMSIELVVMPSFGCTPSGKRDNDFVDQEAESVPSRAKPGTAAMAAQIEASGGSAHRAPAGATKTPHGGAPKPNRSVSVASDATHRPASPGASSISSKTTMRPVGTTQNCDTTSSTMGPPQKRSDFHCSLTSMLDQYRGQNIPESARTNIAASPKEREPMTIARVWQYVPFLVNQGITIGSAVASHAIYGPPKKSWGIEMSVFTRLLRETAAYTQFATVDGMQKFFELASFLPVPKDGLITPVTFRVKCRRLKGFLAEVDAAEDGSRELTGEWVVGKQTWRRLQAEWRGGKAKGTERVVLYIHGGAYFVMSAVTHRSVTISLSKYTECRVFAVNYRLAPATKFPGPLHDVVASWFRLTDDLGIPASNIVLGADSAGGGLACALMYFLRDNQYPLPAGAILFSPWVDLTMSCDSWDTNGPYDYLVVPASHDHMNPVRAYLGENIDRYVTHPYASPLFGDMKGLPPLLIQCGDAECLRDEVTLLAHKASLAGVAVRHELYEDCVHVFQAFLFLDASRKALQSARHFVRTALNKSSGERRSEVTKDSRKQMDQEMRTNMGNSRGEKVEPRTGTRRGDWKEGKPESDTEIEASSVGGELRAGGGDGQDEEGSDEEWELHRREPTEAGRLQPARLAASSLEVGDESVTQMESDDLSEGKVHGQCLRQVERAASGFGSSMPVAAALKGKRRGMAASTSSSESSSLNSMLPISMSLEEAQQRAQAGMRAQESSTAPVLARFHEPTSSLKPKMRRKRSNAAIQSMLEDYNRTQREQQSLQHQRGGGVQDAGLHTRVFTPSSARSGVAGGAAGPN